MKQLRNFMYAFLLLATIVILCCCNNNYQEDNQSNYNYQEKQAEELAKLRSKLQVNVNGAKSIGGGEGSENSRSRSGTAVSRSSASDVVPLVKFYSDGKIDSIFTTMPEYSNMEYCSVENIVVSPDGSVYIVWNCAPKFANVPFINSYYIDLSAGTNDFPATMLETEDVWRITKEGELSWFSRSSFHWGDRGNFSIDENGNLYALELIYNASSNKEKINQYNPNDQTIKTVSLCLSTDTEFKVCGEYIIEQGYTYLRVIPIDSPDDYYYLKRDESNMVKFYDYINKVVITTGGCFYSPFKRDNIVSGCYPWAVFIRDNKVYAIIRNGESGGIKDGVWWTKPASDKIYALNYSNQEYTLDESSVIDVTTISDKLLGNYYASSIIPTNRMNSLGYFYLDSDTEDYFPHIMFVDGTTGAIRDLNTNLPSNIDIYDIAVNETDVYFTGARGTTPISGKINIATGAYTNSGTSVPIKVLATVDF